jgi:hypothetical protein
LVLVQEFVVADTVVVKPFFQELDFRRIFSRLEAILVMVEQGAQHEKSDEHIALVLVTWLTIYIL